MKTINLLYGILFLFLIGIGNSYSASSTVIYPDFQFGTGVVAGVNSPMAMGGKVLTDDFNRLVKMPFKHGSPFEQLLSKPTSLYKTVILEGVINQPLAKKALLTAVNGGVIGLGVTYLASVGLQYAAGQWGNGQQESPPLGFMPLSSCVGELHSIYSCYQLQGPGFYPWDPEPQQCVSWQGYTKYVGGNYYCLDARPPQPTYNPISVAQAQEIAANNPINPTDADYQMMLDAGWAVPIQSNPDVVIDLSNVPQQDIQGLMDAGFFQPTPDSATVKNGQPVTDPLTGQKSQPMIQVEPAPNQGVRLTPYQTPLDANGQPATDAQGNPLPPTQAQYDPCELNPDRAGCANLGTPEDTVIDSVQRTVTGQFNEFSISGQCPADKSFTVAGMTHTIQMAPICGAAENYIKPFLLLMASVTAYFIFVGGLRT